jgi:aspartyl-tRNA(Asn)/glutamyl-tRNA(Gln) amidotransferase subunit C
MAKVTREEIIKIAEMTKVSFHEDELAGIMQQFNDVISYAERVVEIAKQVDIPSQKNKNCNRPDQVITTSNVEILAQAPQVEDNYFVVPKFVDNE